MSGATAAANVRPRRRTKKKQRFRTIKLMFRLAAWVCALGIFWCGYLFWMINSFQEPRSLHPTDTAIVLGAALWNDRPSPGLKERLDHAFKLYEEGKFKAIIVSGGLDHNGSKLTEAEGMKRYLVELGIPEDKLVTEPLARSTYENLLFSKQLMEENGFNSAIVVTHDFHAARAADIAEFIGLPSHSVTGTKSRVLNHAYNESREVLAFTKWKMDKTLLRFGFQLPDLTF